MLFSLGSIAQDGRDQKDKEVETKDQKFIFASNICMISKKEQDDAKGYVINTQEKDILPIKVALIIAQLRTIGNGDFKGIHCSLRYFIEKYNEFADKRRGYSEPASGFKTIVADYAKILEKLRIDPKYKIEFDKNIINGGELNFYYDIIGDFPVNYKLFEISFSRRLFSDYLINKKTQRSLSQDEWQLFFDLYYSKNVAPSKELAASIKTLLIRPGSSNFINTYLINANELAYNDLFKGVFESVNTVNGQFPFVDSNNVNLLTIKGILTSSFIPEGYKCAYTREIVAKNATRISKEDLIEVKKIESPCLKDAIADADKFIIPEVGCPTIDFKKDEDHKRLFTKMNSDFYRTWHDCRKKCLTGDKCTFSQDPSGFYTFYNSKFDSDLILAKEMQSVSPFGRQENLSLKYEIKPVGMCVNNVCAEKLVACSDSDILKKINDELIKSKLQTCQVDNDCFSMPTGLNCSELAVNVNLSPNYPNGQSMGNYGYMPPNNFIRHRISKLTEQCGRPVSHSFGNMCQKPKDSKPTKVSCVKKLCTIASE